MNKQCVLTLTWETPAGTRTARLEFPQRPSEEELGGKLSAFFSVDNFRFDENLSEVHDCILLPPQQAASS